MILRIGVTALWLSSLAWGAAETPCYNDFKADLSRRSLRYFVDHTHPVTGLVRDRARNSERPTMPETRIASIAATGFGMAVMANASLSGLVTKQRAEEYTARTLRFAKQNLFRHRGWFYHFVDWSDGSRIGMSEVSTIDTTLFLTGALYAAYALKSEPLIALAEELYRTTEWAPMLTDDGAKPKKLSLSMGWTPETGYLPWQWDRYAEHLVMIVLGLGHPVQPLPKEAWLDWKREEKPYGDGKILGNDLSLFVHQYSHLYFDFRKIATPKLNLFQNSKLATVGNKDYCSKNSGKYATYAAGFWGLSASDGQDGYAAFAPEFHNGTVCPGCVGASAMFEACPILKDLETWVKGEYGPRIYGPYGFTDGFNLSPMWFSPDALGITVGALYLSLANTDDKTAVWNVFHQIPAVSSGMAKILQREVEAAPENSELTQN